MPDRALPGARQGARRALGACDGDGEALAARQVTPPPTAPEEMKGNKRRFVLLVLILAVLIVLTIAILPFFTQLLSEENRTALQGSIEGMGVWGVIIIFALEVLQVVVAFIPGGVVELIAGALYGTIGGSIIVLAGSLLSAAIVYYLVHKLGAPFVQSFVSKKDMRFFKFLQDPRNLNTMVLILYLIPGLPKDVFTYLVPLTDMPAKDFFILSTLGRAPAVIASAYMGAAMMEGNFIGAVTVFIVIMALALLGIVFRGQLSDVADRVKERLSAFRR